MSNPTDEGVAEVLRILEKQKAQKARRDEQRYFGAVRAAAGEMPEIARADEACRR